MSENGQEKRTLGQRAYGLLDTMFSLSSWGRSIKKPILRFKEYGARTKTLVSNTYHQADNLPIATTEQDLLQTANRSLQSAMVLGATLVILVPLMLWQLNTWDQAVMFAVVLLLLLFRLFVALWMRTKALSQIHDLQTEREGGHD